MSQAFRPWLDQYRDGVQLPPRVDDLRANMITLGQSIRGLRLGFGWSARHACFIRIDGQGPPWQITLAPCGLVPSRFKGVSKDHALWWREKDREEILDMIEPLRGVRKVKRLVQFYVDDLGVLTSPL